MFLTRFLRVKSSLNQMRMSDRQDMFVVLLYINIQIHFVGLGVAYGYL